MYLGDSAEDLKLNILGFLFQMRQTPRNPSSQVHEVPALLPPALLLPGALILQAMLTPDATFRS